MKTIEEAAKETYKTNSKSKSESKSLYLTGNEISYLEQLAFNEGAKFAQRWIPVEENSPNEGQRVLSAPCGNPKDWEVELAFFKYGKFISVHRDIKFNRDKYGEVDSSYYKREELNDTTHWRPIELK